MWRACRRPGKMIAVGSHVAMSRKKPGSQIRLVEAASILFSRTTVSVVLGRVQLLAVSVLYSTGHSRQHFAETISRVAGYDGVAESHVEGVRANGCSQCRARAGKRMPSSAGDRLYRYIGRHPGSRGCVFPLFWRRRDSHGHVVTCL